MTIFFDLDGTLIDASERMFRLFSHIIPHCSLSKEQYWNYKRNRISHEILLNKFFPEYDFCAFNEKWLSMIELPDYLAMDKLYPDTLFTLNQLSSTNQLILLTARQNREELLSELDKFDLIKYFHIILSTGKKCTKEELLRDTLEKRYKKSEDDLFVSDVGKDIAIGNKYNFKTIAITHGFMDKALLQEYHPTFIIDELREILSIVDKVYDL